MVRLSRQVPCYVLAIVAGVALGVAPAVAVSSGITTLSFGSPALGCNNCHGGGATPTAVLSGPTTVAPESTNEYTLTINAVGSQTLAGFNVSTAFGTLSVGGSNALQTHALTGSHDRTEITHLGPKASSDGSTKFSFLWTAPGSFTNATLNAWGNAVNGDGTNGGDRAVLATLTVSSTDPGPNPTATPTVTPTPTATPVMRDSVIAPLKPLTVKIPAGALSVSKKLSVKVTNANPTTAILGHTTTVTHSTTCPPEATVSAVDFGSGAMGGVFLAPGKAKTGKVTVTIPSQSFTPLNRIAMQRCSITFVAAVSGGVDPSPANNSATVELNVFDKNDPDQETIDESFIDSGKPVKINIRDGDGVLAKAITLAVGNGDIVPVAENPGHSIAVSAIGGDCPAGTVGTITPSPVTPKGGKKQGLKLLLNVDPATFTTLSLKSPARCVVEVGAAGPVEADPDPGNNTTRLVIDVIDANDF